MKKEFNPYMAYIPLYGIYYVWKNINEMFESTIHWTVSSLINCHAIIYAFGLICHLYNIG